MNFRNLGQPTDTSNLEKLISQFRRNGHSAFTDVYHKRLEISRTALHGQQTTLKPDEIPAISLCLEYRNQCQHHLTIALSSIRSTFAPLNLLEEIFMLAGLWPRVHSRTLLYPLASTSNISLTQEWTENLTDFAELFIEYQLSQRLLAYAYRSEGDNFFKELQNASFNRSDAKKNPDWLLIQVRMKHYRCTVHVDI